MRLVTLMCALSACVLAFGCEDLGDFKPRPDQVFGGEVIGSDSASMGDSFVRKGFASHTQLELRFDPDAGGLTQRGDAGVSSATTSYPGTIDTYVCPHGHADCASVDRVAGPFQHARLISIDGLAHDTLSQYTFPGGGRLRNYIFGVHFISRWNATEVPRDATVFVSLMDSGRIEVRALAPAVVGTDGDSERLPGLFGVFVLRRRPR